MTPPPDAHGPVPRRVGFDDASVRARHRRERLHQACLDLQEGCSSEDLDRLGAAIRQAHTTVVAHVAESEAADGLLAQVIEDEPAFGSRVEDIQAEHRVMLTQAEQLVDALSKGLGFDELRRRTDALIDVLDEHRHRAAELLFDTYGLDLSAVD